MFRLTKMILRTAIVVVVLGVLVAIFAPKLLLAAKAHAGEAASVLSSVKGDLASGSGGGGSTSTGSAAGIRSVHTPQTLVNDITLASGQCHVRVIDGATGEFLADAACTPGAIDPAVTQANMAPPSAPTATPPLSGRPLRSPGNSRPKA